MSSFYQFWDKMNGVKESPPTGYTFAPYLDGPISGADGVGAELRPLTPEDMSRYAAKDVEDWFLKHGKNSTRLGEPMTDAEFQRHHGIV